MNEMKTSGRSAAGVDCSTARSYAAGGLDASWENQRPERCVSRASRNLRRRLACQGPLPREATAWSPSALRSCLAPKSLRQKDRGRPFRHRASRCGLIDRPHGGAVDVSATYRAIWIGERIFSRGGRGHLDLAAGSAYGLMQSSPASWFFAQSFTVSSPIFFPGGGSLHHDELPIEAPLIALAERAMTTLDPASLL
jgi:hypothetical protein